jgi:hypothetical protein
MRLRSLNNDLGIFLKTKFGLFESTLKYEKVFVAFMYKKKFSLFKLVSNDIDKSRKLIVVSSHILNFKFKKFLINLSSFNLSFLINTISSINLP